jgi:excisionase family DNA binding protein
MAAVGNLNDYIKYQMAQSLEKGEGGGLAGAATQLGAGLAMGQQIAQALGAAQSTPPTPSIRPAIPPVNAGAGAGGSAAAPEMLTPANAALVLNVSESDVLSALADGSLKGKKIGASWRITRAALDDFMKT